MQRGSFWEIVWSSFKKVYAGPMAAVGFLGAGIYYVFAFPESPGARVAVAVAIVVGTLLLVLLLTFIDAAYTLYKN